jgi:hypothetical protein
MAEVTHHFDQDIAYELIIIDDQYICHFLFPCDDERLLHDPEMLVKPNIEQRKYRQGKKKRQGVSQTMEDPFIGMDQILTINR